MTRLAALVILLLLALVAIAWHVVEVLDRLLGGDGATVGLTPEHRDLIDADLEAW